MITVTDAPSEAERDAVLAPLRAHNAALVGPTGHRPFAALLRDEAGRVVGGAIGHSRHGWLYVELLFVPEALRGRGLGEALMAAAEAEARARGCRGIHLFTATFQAPGFYERLGFRCLGALPDHPPGHQDRWYAKEIP